MPSSQPAIRRVRKRRSQRSRSQAKVLLAFCLTVAVAVAGVALLHRPQSIPNVKSAASPASYIVKLNGPIIPSAAGLAVAIAGGLFQRYGLDVSLQSGSSDQEALDATKDDNVISVVTASSFLRARADGSRIIAFAGGYVSSPVEFYCLAGSPIRIPRDFEDRIIGYPDNSDIAVVVDAFITHNEIAASRLAIKHDATSIKDLLAGNVDILAGRWDVEGAALRAAGANFRSVSPESFGVHIPGTVYVANERLFAASREVLVKFLAALSAGWEATYSDVARSSATVSDFAGSPLGKEEIAYLLERQRPLLRSLDGRFGELETRRWRDLQTLLLKQRLVPNTDDLSTAVNLEVLKQAGRILFPALKSYPEPRG